MVRCCASVSTIMAVKDRTTSSSRAKGSCVASSPSIDRTPVSGCAAASSARWSGKYRYAVVREIDAAAATSGTVGASPRATISRAAATSAARVRLFCSTRPPAS